MFLLLTGDTAAGEKGALRFDSHEEANLVWWGSPLPEGASRFDGSPEVPPAIFTRAARLVSDFPLMIIRGGSRILPLCPFMESGASPGNDPAKEKAVPEALRLWDSGFSIGRLAARMADVVVIGESIAGGDRTASMLLRSFGLLTDDDGYGEAWNEASARTGIKEGEMKGRGFDALTELGDPVQIVAAGVASGARGNAEVLLAGGVPMLAVAALLRNMGDSGPIRIVTTSRTAEDVSAGFRPLAEALKAETVTLPLDDVPDGAGAGGAAWYSERLGISAERCLQRARFLCGELARGTPEDKVQ